MKRSIVAFLIFLALTAGVYLAIVVHRGFSAADKPSGLERIAARAVRNVSIPSRAQKEENPLSADTQILAEAREHFENRCANAMATTETANRISVKTFIRKRPISACPPRKISPTAKSTTSSRMGFD
jgi:hypothetical protein